MLRFVAVALFVGLAAATNKECEEGWSTVPQIGCYTVVVGKQSWDDAKKTCRDAGGSIVQVDTKKEWNAVSLLANLMGARRGFWLNLRDSVDFDEWYEGPNLKSWHQDLWAEGEPLNSLCVAAKRYRKEGGGNEYRWTTRMCNSDEDSARDQFSVVCEQRLKGT